MSRDLKYEYLDYVQTEGLLASLNYIHGLIVLVQFSALHHLEKLWQKLLCW